MADPSLEPSNLFPEDYQEIKELLNELGRPDLAAKIHPGMTDYAPWWEAMKILMAEASKWLKKLEERN